MISIALTLILLVFAHAAENGNEAVSSTENRLLNLETQPEIVAFVLGDNDEVVPMTAGHTGGANRRNMFLGRRSLQGTQPSPADQYMLELINAARANPQNEANVLLNGDLNQGLPAGTITADAKPPLTFDFELWRAAYDHSQWMLDNNVFSHTGRDGSSPTQRMQSAGYILSPPWSTGENIAYRGTTGTPDLVQFTKNNHDNLFVSPGHRRNLMSGSFEEVGVSNVAGRFNNYNAVMTTQNFAYSGNRGPFITGVVYTDAVNDNDFYDAGEGLSGIIITAEDKQNPANLFTTTSLGAGGFTLDVNANTVYKVTFSGDLRGDGTSMTAVYEVSVNTENVKQDCVSDKLPVSNLPPSSEPTNPSTSQPTFKSTNLPSLEPTMEPTMQRTNLPSLEPTMEPTMQRTNLPSLEPTMEPTQLANVPSLEPTMEPTMQLTSLPSLEPTMEPTQLANMPSLEPTMEPTMQLTSEPTRRPRWGKWGPWSQCSVTCGSGSKTRTRSCLTTGCVGKSVKTKTCNRRACDVQVCDWEALPVDECPGIWEAYMMADCHDGMVSGELCEADSTLPNNNRNYNINNCGAFDVFRYSCEGTR